MKYSLKRKYLHIFIASTVLLLLMSGLSLAYLFHVQKIQDQSEAKAQGEGIVSSIQRELTRCYDTTLLMTDLYAALGQQYLDSFRPITAEFQKDNLAIGSMYWAPSGVIHYAYPETVDSATLNFEMLKDPIQGPKAQVAVASRKATIAGPHNLIEGGKGFIIRTPYFDEDSQFVAFAIMVIDSQVFVKQVIQNLSERELGYRFAVWKDSDPTATLEEGDYIFFNDGPIAHRVLTIPFDAPNDHWYLTLEPVGGWNTISHMHTSIVIIFVIFVILLLCTYFFIYNRQIKRGVYEMNHERARIQELERYQTELERARDMAEAANQSKTFFLNNMSHDIRTPMNAILGFAELMEKKTDNPELIADYLLKIKNSGKYLLDIINNVLDMARIESGKAVLDRSFFDASDPKNNIIPIFEEMARKKNIHFTCTSNIQHLYVMVDATKSNQITMNLVSNAIKYTPEGGNIDVSLNEVPCQREGYATYVMTVSDTGIGMSPDFLEHIFDSFSRERTTTESKVIGSGLGMSIVKKLVDLAGGRIEIQSELGKGTTISVYIDHPIVDNPEQYIHQELMEKKDIVSFDGKHALLTEDNELNAEIATAILTEMGFIVERAEDGVQCIKMLSEADAHHYDIIFMDIQMPNLNGYESTIRIRSLADPAKANIPIIAMTANAFDEDKKLAADAGMNGHLSKPINVKELMDTLARIL